MGQIRFKSNYDSVERMYSKTCEVTNTVFKSNYNSVEREIAADNTLFKSNYYSVRSGFNIENFKAAV